MFSSGATRRRNRAPPQRAPSNIGLGGVPKLRRAPAVRTPVKTAPPRPVAPVIAPTQPLSQKEKPGAVGGDMASQDSPFVGSAAAAASATGRSKEGTKRRSAAALRSSIRTIKTAKSLDKAYMQSVRNSVNNEDALAELVEAYTAADDALSQIQAAQPPESELRDKLAPQRQHVLKRLAKLRAGMSSPEAEELGRAYGCVSI